MVHFFFGMSSSIKNSLCVKCWYDPSCGGELLKECLLVPFSLAVHKVAWVLNYWNGLCWNPGFRRDFSDWGLILVESLLLLLSYSSVSRVIAD